MNRITVAKEVVLWASKAGKLTTDVPELSNYIATLVAKAFLSVFDTCRETKEEGATLFSTQ